MSFDLAVWIADEPVTAPEAAATYRRVAAETDGAAEGRDLESFRAELLRRFPPAETLPDDQIDDAAWASPITVSGRHALLPIVRSRAAEVAQVVYTLAARHGLVCFDPQTGTVRNPPRPEAGPTEASPAEASPAEAGPTDASPTEASPTEAGPTDASPLRLETADGSVVDQPDEATLRRLVGGLSPANWYAILERRPEHYLQAGLGRNAGVPDGQFSLEHRDGGPQAHYRCVLADRDRVVEAFAGFAAGRPGWADGLGWQRLVL